MNEKLKDILIRALKTFWQASLAAIVVAIPEIVDLVPQGWQAIKPVLISAGIGAIAAGCSAVYNGLIKPFADKHKVVAVEDGGEISSNDESK